MNFRLVFKLTGKTLLVEAGALLLPLLVCLFYRENPLPFLLSIAMTGAVGLALSLIPSNDHFFPREGFFAVALIWLLMSAFGALPFFFSGFFPSYVDCFFESVSGFTTTGASILTAVEPLPRGILFWRSFMHWMGGMGVLILTIALLPSLGGRTLHVMRAESPGPIVSKLVPKTSQSSKILYGIYCALTLLEVFCLRIAGMPWYDSLVHSFATAGTGGFSNRNLSVGAYGNPTAEIIIAIFALLFSLNFGLYFLLLQRRFKEALKSDEARFFLLLVAGSTALITINIMPIYENVWDSLRYAFFQVASIISTTGFATADFVLWPHFSQMILVILMFCGACAGSTGGGIKCSRVVMLLRSIRRELHRIAHPRSVEVVRLDGKPVDESTLHSVLVFIGFYILIILTAALVVSLDNVPFDVSFSAALTCVSNVGPGLATIGPSGNFAAFSPLSKVVLSLCMIIGRLEIFPILVLFSRHTWRRN